MNVGVKGLFGPSFAFGLSNDSAGPAHDRVADGLIPRPRVEGTHVQNVVGLFNDRVEAENAVHRLRNSGVSPDAISVAMKATEVTSDPGPTSAPTLAESTGTTDLAAEGTAVGAVSGAAVGTLVGLLVAGSTFVLPGVGTFLVAGPLAAALTGAGVGAASGGLIGALVGSGIPESEAGVLATEVETGRAIVVARVDENESADVRLIFDEEGSRRTYCV